MMLDTSGLFAFLNAKDPDNQRAIAAYEDATVRYTHNYVAAELVALATARKFDRFHTINYINDLMRTPEVDFIWIDESTHREAVDLLLNRRDKAYSLCDAVSFVIMKRIGIIATLTTDKHFEQEGFIRLLAWSVRTAKITAPPSLGATCPCRPFRTLRTPSRPKRRSMCSPWPSD